MTLTILRLKLHAFLAHARHQTGCLQRDAQSAPSDQVDFLQGEQFGWKVAADQLEELLVHDAWPPMHPGRTRPGELLLQALGRGKDWEELSEGGRVERDQQAVAFLELVRALEKP